MAIPSADLAGHRVLRDRVHAALETCVESQGIEFKESAPWNALQYKIAKTAMAMANLRDGGILIIGVSERAEAWDRTGISDDDFSTYDADDVVDGINKFASPPFSVRVVQVSHEERRYLVIEVPESPTRRSFAGATALPTRA